MWFVRVLKYFFDFSREKEGPLINVLTRTSNRPNGFKICHNSIREQTYKNVRHIVSYDAIEDLQYLEKYDVDKIEVSTKTEEDVNLKDCIKEFKPYNLYCNQLLGEVSEGWVIFLDDDDRLKDKKVLKRLVKTIRSVDEDTLIIGQTRYPDGKLLPSNTTFMKEEIVLRQIDTACFIFHSKFKNSANWDCWWAADFRFIRDLSQKIPKQKWIHKVLTQKNTSGGLGKRIDVSV